MNRYMITTDNMGDLPKDYLEKNMVPTMSLTYMLDGKSYNEEHPLEPKAFYAKMRSGCMPTTSQVNPEEAKACLEKYLKDCPNIIHIAFSSGLSGTYNSTRIAAQELMEEHPEYNITVVDSLCASLGEGLLVHKALELQKKGAAYEEVVAFLEQKRMNICHCFTVDDLFHLHRGGRVSKAAAIVGTMINLKPVLHVDNEGKLVPTSKVRGRKKALNTLVDNMEKQMGSFRDQNDIVFISHGDCIEDAEYVKSLIEKRFGISSFLINYVGPTIGAHSGPGTLALFFIGDVR